MIALPGVLPELVAAERRLSALATARGWAYKLADWDGAAVRSQADTTKHLRIRDVEYARYLLTLKPGQAPVPKLKWRMIAPYGSSYHNFGAAFDAEPIRCTFAQLGSLAAAAGLVWGGKDDPGHFRLPITLLEARARWLAFGNAPGVARVATPTATGAVVVLVIAGSLLGLLARAHHVG